MFFLMVFKVLYVKLGAQVFFILWLYTIYLSLASGFLIKKYNNNEL